MTFDEVHITGETKMRLEGLPLNSWPHRSIAPSFGFYSSECNAYFLEHGSNRRAGVLPVQEYFSLVYQSVVVEITGLLSFTRKADGRQLAVWDVQEVVVPLQLQNDPEVHNVLFKAMTESLREAPQEADRLVTFQGNLDQIPVQPGVIY